MHDAFEECWGGVSSEGDSCLCFPGPRLAKDWAGRDPAVGGLGWDGGHCGPVKCTWSGNQSARQEEPDEHCIWVHGPASQHLGLGPLFILEAVAAGSSGGQQYTWSRGAPDESVSVPWKDESWLAWYPGVP